MIKRYFSGYQKAFKVNNINQNLINAEYAVRGKIPTRAQEIIEELRNGSTDYSFNKIAQLNIGNPQIFKQKPIALMRQVIGRTLLSSSCRVNKGDCNASNNLSAFEHFNTYESKNHADAVVQMSEFHLNTLELGGYSQPGGAMSIRESTARFLTQRDGVEARPENIFLTNGASVGIKFCLDFLIDTPEDGIMIPIPQYPIYSAILTLLDGRAIDYYLNEEDNWNVTYEDLNESLQKSVEKGTKPRAIVVINPGNPTGNVLSKQGMQDIVRFAFENNICILADEVYQENIYGANEWFSFKQIMSEMSAEIRDNTPLISFHSISKGVFGECGLRGGYMEFVNFSDSFMQKISTKMNYFFPNLAGQLALDFKNKYLAGELEEQLENEVLASIHDNYNSVSESLSFRANQASKFMKDMKNVKSNPIGGALYAFPSLLFPERFIREAEVRGLKPDVLYCLELLENTGICVVPGSGFGQKDGTHHLRTTILPQPDDYFVDVFKTFKEFNNRLMDRYED